MIRKKANPFILLFSCVMIFTTCVDDYKLWQPLYEKIDIAKIDRVLILGNSITINEPNAELEWFGNWGMAASSQETDYVHLLINEFQNQKSTIEIHYFNISKFEREFWRYDHFEIDDLTSFNPNLLILNLGENVNEKEAKRHGFGACLFQLITFLTEIKSTKYFV